MKLSDEQFIEKKFKEKWEKFLDIEKLEFKILGFEYRNINNEHYCFLRCDVYFVKLNIKEKLIKHFKNMVDEINKEVE